METALLVGSLLLAWLAIRIQLWRAWLDRYDGVIARLDALWNGAIERGGWGDIYFGKPYDDDRIKDRVAQTQQQVMSGTPDQVFVVPVDLVASLIQDDAANQLLASSTITACGIAEWQLGKFNQFARLQADFNAQHGPDIADTGEERRSAVASSAGWISGVIHGEIIGSAGSDTGWYGKLKSCLRSERARLAKERASVLKAWWNSAPGLATVEVLSVLGCSALALTWLAEELEMTGTALTAAGLTATVLGALVLAWRDLAGTYKPTYDDVSKGFRDRRGALIGFPLIALGSVLQLISTQV